MPQQTAARCRRRRRWRQQLGAPCTARGRAGQDGRWTAAVTGSQLMAHGSKGQGVAQAAGCSQHTESRIPWQGSSLANKPTCAAMRSSMCWCCAWRVLSAVSSVASCRRKGRQAGGRPCKAFNVEQRNCRPSTTSSSTSIALQWARAWPDKLYLGKALRRRRPRHCLLQIDDRKVASHGAGGGCWRREEEGMWRWRRMGSLVVELLSSGGGGGWRPAWSAVMLCKRPNLQQLRCHSKNTHTSRSSLPTHRHLPAYSAASSWSGSFRAGSARVRLLACDRISSTFF